MNRTIATLLVDQFESYGIEYVFCVPGASIDAILTALKGRRPKLILCRHEGSAGQMAVAYGKKTRKPAVVLVTAGPGATNLVTPVATATAEHAPLIAICGQMDSRSTFKPSHQVINEAELFEPVSKWSREITNPLNLTSEWDMAYNLAIQGPAGAVHLALAADLLALPTDISSTRPLEYLPSPRAGSHDIEIAKQLIHAAKYPLIVLGGDVNGSKTVEQVHKLLRATHMSVIATFEGRGQITGPEQEYFIGRIGVFQNQPCDEAIKKADLFITLGYNIAELDPIKWNQENKPLIHIADFAPIIADGYRPTVQLLGDIAENIRQLATDLNYQVGSDYLVSQKEIKEQLEKRRIDFQKKPHLLHPLFVIETIQKLIRPVDTLVSDVGTHQYWISEYFISQKPHQYINSMGFQTLGVSLPFAIGAAFAQKEGKVYSISGDGGILYCMMEMATAVEHHLPIIHLVWKDKSYNLVAIQEEHKYHTTNAVQFVQDIDFVKMAESYGIQAFRVTEEEALEPVLKQAQTITSPVLIEIAIDYSDNLRKIIEAIHGT